ncbi:MAG: glycosyltransferase [Candidatus Micrarchaeia archaeon]
MKSDIPANEVLLSICIPTFNREKKLEKVLEAISLDAAPFGKEVEVCVSDNCSADQTEKMVGEWSGRMPLKYHRQKSNLGYDLNLLSAIGMASGRFAWLMSDDDGLVQGAVGRVLADIRECEGKKAGAIYVPVDNPQDRRPSVKQGFGSFRIFSKNDKGYSPLIITFIGTICLKRETAEKVIKSRIKITGSQLEKTSKNRYVLDDFLHSYLFLECAEEEGFFGIDPRPGVLFVSDHARVSYDKVVYYQLLHMLYSLELLEFYPWFNDAAGEIYLKPYLILKTAAQAAHKPSLEAACQASIDIYAEIMDKKGRRIGAAAARLFDFARKLPLAGSLLSSVLVALSRSRGSKLAYECHDGKVQEKIGFLVSRYGKYRRDAA